MAGKTSLDPTVMKNALLTGGGGKEEVHRFIQDVSPRKFASEVAGSSIFTSKAFLILIVFLLFWGVGGNVVQTIFKEVPLALIIGVAAVWVILK